MHAYIILEFEPTDPSNTEGIRDFLESPVLLIPETQISSLYEQGFDMKLTGIRYPAAAALHAPESPPPSLMKTEKPTVSTGKPTVSTGKPTVKHPMAPATESQIKFLRTLFDERMTPSPIGDELLVKELEKNPAYRTRQEVSDIIGRWTTLPKRPTGGVAGIKPGYYMTTDASTGETTYWWVKEDKYKRARAKILHKNPEGNYVWVYSAGGVARLMGTVSMTPLTKGAAAAFGRATDHCVICGRQLRDPASVKLGIGPICMAKI